MGDLHLVLPALNLSSLNAGILIMMHQVRLIMFSLNMVDYSLTFLLLSTWDFFCWTSRGDHSEPFLLFDFCRGTTPSCLKVMGGGVVVAHKILVSAQGPLVLVLGLRVWGQGLTISVQLTGIFFIFWWIPLTSILFPLNNFQGQVWVFETLQTTFKALANKIVNSNCLA